MILTYVPDSTALPLPPLARQGDALAIGPERFDLTGLPEGGVLPAEALAGPWWAGDVTREGGVVRVALRWPESAGEPPEPGVLAEGPLRETRPGHVTWDLLCTALQRAEARREARRRDLPPLPVPDLADRAVAAGHITDPEADGWVLRTGLPAAITAAIDRLPEAQRASVRRRILGATAVSRLSDEVAFVADAMGLTPAQVDALFGAPPA